MTSAGTLRVLERPRIAAQGRLPRAVLRPVALLALGLVAAAAVAQVPYERIANADREPQSWMTYSRNYTGQRYSPLAEVNAGNVQNLRMQWAYQMPDPANETSPLVVDGILYLTGPSSATALDARTGRVLWTWKRPIPPDFHLMQFAAANRGAAVLGNTLYVGTLDCYLVALDLKSGAERWATKVVDYSQGYGMTGAPLAIDGKVITGVAGGEAGIRGLLDAYDAATGKRLWRFWTIPGPDDKAAYETWGGDSAKSGGGPTWVTGAYDPALKLIYWGIGNPSPDWNGDPRPGDNLYTDSFVALDEDTGKMRWHFQFTPHDTHDWDAGHVPVLIDAVVKGRERRLIVNANRNGFYYVLDRVTGEFLTGQAYARQTWAKGLDAKGRPLVIAATDPSDKGTFIWPNANGATIWFSPSYDPTRRWIYVPVRTRGATYFKRAMQFRPGRYYPGGGETEMANIDVSGEVRAMDALTGDMKWTFPLLSPATSGVLSTAGGLVFTGTDEGDFLALDSATGRPLWHVGTGSRIQSNPMSFGIDGRQLIAVSADRVLFVFGLK
jgi:alcohol dehydrogenase (cytochrome c)